MARVLVQFVSQRVTQTLQFPEGRKNRSPIKDKGPRRWSFPSAKPHSVGALAARLRGVRPPGPGLQMQRKRSCHCVGANPPTDFPGTRRPYHKLSLPGGNNRGVQFHRMKETGEKNGIGHGKQS